MAHPTCGQCRTFVSGAIAASSGRGTRAEWGTHRAGQRYILAVHTIPPALVAARLMNFVKEAGERVLVAERAARTRRIQLVQAVVVELSHVVHAAETGANQVGPTHVPERLEDPATLAGADIDAGRRPVRWALPTPGLAAAVARLVGRDPLQALEHLRQVALRLRARRHHLGPAAPQPREQQQAHGEGHAAALELHRHQPAPVRVANGVGSGESEWRSRREWRSGEWGSRRLTPGRFTELLRYSYLSTSSCCWKWVPRCTALCDTPGGQLDARCHLKAAYEAQYSVPPGLPWVTGRPRLARRLAASEPVPADGTAGSGLHEPPWGSVSPRIFRPRRISSGRLAC
jgi:hypothetical protein